MSLFGEAVEFEPVSVGYFLSSVISCDIDDIEDTFHSTNLQSINTSCRLSCCVVKLYCVVNSVMSLIMLLSMLCCYM